MNNIFKLLIMLAIPQVAGIVGAVFTMPAIKEWYQFLMKPELAPPNWIFAPVWTSLFVLMGIAAFLVWKKGTKRPGVKLALVLFITQLVFNTLWSIIFFGLRAPGVALIELVFFWSAIAATIWAFGRVSKTAAWLLVPYLAWVSFAAYLNYGIWMLN